MIAALFVAKGGCYFGLDGVDPWDEERDARKYPGPHPVVAHPPCERWGRYWWGGPSSRVRFEKGADDGCFASALDSVRRYGGVLEHPAGSAAWKAHGLVTPSPAGGWTDKDAFGGMSCRVDQGHYGHRAQKATWLYACHVKPLELIWGKAPRPAHVASDRRSTRTGACQRLSKKQRRATPPEFRDLLLSVAIWSAVFQRAKADATRAIEEIARLDCCPKEKS
jgi:hypothetical protein